MEITSSGGDVPSDVPWVRSQREIDETFARIETQLQQLAAGPGRTVDQLSPGEHYALGVRAAAQWTMGRQPVAPLTEEELPPDIASVAQVMTLAESLINGDGTPDQVAALAGGVRAWLVWLIGADDRMVLRSFD